MYVYLYLLTCILGYDVCGPILVDMHIRVIQSSTHLISVYHKNFSCSCTQLIDQSHATATCDSVVQHSFIQCPSVASLLVICTFPVLDGCLLDIYTWYTQAAWNTMEIFLVIISGAPTKKKEGKENYNMEKIHIRHWLCLQIKPGSSEKNMFASAKW